MSDLIRMYGMTMSHGGTCRVCGVSRQKGNHEKCDRWPGGMSSKRGFHYRSNSEESTLADLKKMVEIICKGEDDSEPVQFDIKIRHAAMVSKRKAAKA